MFCVFLFFFSSRRRHTRWTGDWSSDVCSSDLAMKYPVSRFEMMAAMFGANHPFSLIDAMSDLPITLIDRKSTRLNSSHPSISYAVFCLKKKKKKKIKNLYRQIQNTIRNHTI